MNFRGHFKRYRASQRLLVFNNAGQQSFDVDWLCKLFVFKSAEVGQNAIDHALHGIDILVQFVLKGGLVHQLGAQSHAGEWCP
ncbi:hypothetical protein D9M68_794910 [compost metagenome]